MNIPQKPSLICRSFRSLSASVATFNVIVVGETACSRGKGRSRSARKTMLAALVACGLGAWEAALAAPPTTVVPTGGKTNAYTSANGVPVELWTAGRAMALPSGRVNHA